MNSPTPLTPDYASPAASPNTKHDHIYTTLLAVLAMVLVMAILTLNALRWRPTIEPEAKAALLLPLSVEACFLAAVFVGLFIRLIFPAARRWPTLGLNVFLLLFVPLDTALAIYGFWKVDKALPDDGKLTADPNSPLPPAPPPPPPPPPP